MNRTFPEHVSASTIHCFCLSYFIVNLQELTVSFTCWFIGINACFVLLNKQTHYGVKVKLKTLWKMPKVALPQSVDHNIMDVNTLISTLIIANNLIWQSKLQMFSRRCKKQFAVFYKDNCLDLNYAQTWFKMGPMNGGSSCRCLLICSVLLRSVCVNAQPVPPVCCVFP